MESEEKPTEGAEPPPPPKPEDPAAEGDKKKKPGKEKKGKAQREYLGWESANDIEWRTEMEYQSYKKWKDKFGPGTEWANRYEEWICSGMTRGVMRKPCFRAIEWLQWQRGIEVSPEGECHTRKRCGIKDYFVEPIENYCCKPCPWPKTTSGEVGWLGQHESCRLEIYPNDFMKKPPLPWYHKKISSQLPGSM